MKILIVTVVAALVALPAAATVFCGCNGEVVLSFTEPPAMTSVLEIELVEDGLTSVDVYAVLDGVVELEGPGGVFLDLGGFELELCVTGAEVHAVDKKVLIPHRDFGARPTQCLVGTDPGVRIVGAPLALVRWRVVFKGEAQDVRFDLDPAGMLSCDRTPECEGCGASAVYVGSVDARQEGYLFGAGCVPAVLNPSAKPDLTPAPCNADFVEAGVFEVR